MKIYINKKEVVLPSDFSMSYDVENRFFTQSTEGWSLDFDLPLRGCPRNLAIFGAVNRKDVKLSTLSWPCMISHGSFVKQGLAVPISVNEKSISLQFLDGRSEVNYESPLESTIIRNISLPYSLSIGTTATRKSVCLNNAQKDADNNYWELALPWVNNYSGSIQNKIDTSNQTTDTDTGLIYYPYHSNVTEVSCQIYLIELTRRILVALNYTVDLTAWGNSVWKYLLVWNAVPAAWEERYFNIALPKWTVLELLQEIEVLTGLDFDINEKEKTVVAKFAPAVVSTAGVVKIDKVEETFEMEIDDDSDVDFVGAYELKYADRDDKEWLYESCKENVNRMVEEGTLVENPITMNLCTWTSGQMVYGAKGRDTGATINIIKYDVSEKGRFLVLRLLDAVTASSGVGFAYHTTPQFLNEFGATTAGDDATFKEIKIVPARVAQSTNTTHDGSDDFILLDPGEYNNEPITEPTTIDEANAYRDNICRNIEENEEIVEYYDKLYVSFWKKDMAYRGSLNTCLSQNNSQVGVRERMRTPQYGMRSLFPTGGTTSWSSVLYNEDMSLSLDRRTNSNWYLGKIDKTRKYTFKWISKTLPEVKSVFLVNGRRFYCAVIKTQWSINGMSEELEGEFYEIL